MSLPADAGLASLKRAAGQSAAAETDVGAPDGRAVLRMLLTSGGDERIWQAPASGRNRYGVPPFPAPGEIWLSSSTASAISPAGFEAAQAMLDRLTGNSAHSLSPPHFFDDLRQRLLTLYGAADSAAVLVPSGTEGELAVLAIAHGLMPGPITNIVIAPEETGSGVMMAASGRQFLATTSLGADVEKGGPVAGLDPDRIEVRTVPIRNAAGQPLPPAKIDIEAKALAQAALASGRNVVLHVLDSSKTGLSGVSRKAAVRIARSAPNRVLVVVDACQLRCGADRVREDLTRGFTVLLSGSKFAAGPPFAGALLIPGVIVEALAKSHEPLKGLGGFSALFDWPAALHHCVDPSLSQSTNFGLGLRWTAALESLEQFERINPELRDSIARRFESETRRRIAQSPALAYLPGQVSHQACRTIVPFLVLSQNGTPATFEQVARVYDLMGAADCGPAVHLGQPVALGQSTVLRICASAPQFVAIAERYHQTSNMDHAMAPLLGELDTAFAKLHETIEICGLTVRAGSHVSHRLPATGDDKSKQANLDPTDWEEFATQSHAALDMMISHLRGVSDRPVWQSAPADSRAAFAKSLPRSGRNLSNVLEDFQDHILPYATGNTHPLFMGWVHGAGTPVGMIAEMLAGGLNANCGGRNHIAIDVERQIARWAAEMFSYPSDASGIFVTGTSMANFMGLLIARDAAIGHDVRKTGLRAPEHQLVVYASAEAHACIEQATELSGIGSANLRQIPADTGSGIDTGALRRAIAADRKAGLRPFMIVATAGTVNTGAIDDLDTIASLAQSEGLWFHVDGAFGALAALSPKLRPRLKGIERSNSVAFDFHKWAHVPYDAGFLLVRDPEMHKGTFASPAAYLQRAPAGLGAGETWPCDLGPDLSRGFRALKTWMTIESLGADRIAGAIENCCDVAAYLAQQLEAAATFELAAPVTLNIVCFALRGSNCPDIHEKIVVDLHERGVAAPSTTTLNGRHVIRAAIVNHRTERAHIDRFICELEKSARTIAG